IAAVISGLTAVGEDLTAGRWVKNGKSMVDALLTFKLDNNSFYYAITPWSPEPVTDHMATRQALKALADLAAAGYGNVPLYRQIAAPVASPQAGPVDRDTSVSLSSATPGATIYYTTDGSVPTSGSTVYTLPITINSAVTIKAIAVKENMHDSMVATFNYTIREASGGPGVPANIVVSVTIIGKNTTYFSGNVNVAADRPNALEALKMTGVPYQTRNADSYVLQIAGEREDLTRTAGWKYMVNNIEPGTAAKNYPIQNGDSVIWFWVERYDISQPGGGAIIVTPVPNAENNDTRLTAENFQDVMIQTVSGIKQLREMLQAELSRVPLEITAGTVTVVGKEESMPEEEKEELRKLLKENLVNIRQPVMQGEDALITDEANEVSLKVGAGALAESKEITVEEVYGDGGNITSTHYLVSPLYRFGPAGTVFKEPVLLSIRLAIPDNIPPGELVLAWFDEARQQWFALPTVVDLSQGFISAEVSHFTKFAVLARKAPVKTFSDVHADNYTWAVNEVNYLATRGIVRGVGEGLFEPARQITRAEFTTLVVKALALDTRDTRGTGTQFFKDVRPGDWFAPYVKAAVHEGLVRGVDENVFKPHDLITREQMAVILARAFAADLQDEAGLNFRDAGDVSAWAVAALKKVLSRGLLKGYADGTLKPGHPVTRAEAAVTIYRLLLE
ncbi:MAG: S-layer homology domain-containing protein, partial [Bacillota bacterium]